MSLSPQQKCTVCYAVCLLLGVTWMIIGMVVIPSLPYFQLDAVLTPEELADPQKKAAPLAMLQKANANQWMFWTGAGFSLILVNTYGIFALRKLPRLQETHQ